ncbi:MAG: hypothetical protein K1X66_01255 [Verrucomicrobiae bacterium]|nr:hypothetical protein [Verrucomicrobiae bacterium]
MDETSILQFLKDTFQDIHIVTSNGNHFFFYSPDGTLPERAMPFATLVTNDDYDKVSLLNRPGVFRLNIGISKTTYHSLLGQPPVPPGSDDVTTTEHDFTAFDQLLPHPIYGHLFWVCILNPSPTTFDQTIKPLLIEAYETALNKQKKREML